MRVVFGASAKVDLERIADWISAKSPAAALATIARIESKMLLLETPGLETMGRPGLAQRTRELVVYPYIIIYRIDAPADEVVVLAVFHGAQERDPR